jgi:arabinogalactan endo-1,4-beta-galactosidase
MVNSQTYVIKYEDNAMLYPTLKTTMVCTLVILIGAIGAIHPTPVAAEISMMGADVSSLQRAEDLGQKFYYANGTQGDPLQILKDNGINYVRLRIWNNPASGYNNESKVLAFAKVVKAKGLQLMIDFHYSDYWADPGKQYPPAAWASDNISELQTDLYDYTYKVCNDLKSQGTTPDSVQIGNEINTGMDWPVGEVINNNFTNLGLLLKQGYEAIKACNSGTQVIIHIADAGNDSSARWFYDGIKAQGVKWDITGLSYYCYWHGSMSNMTHVVSDMKSRYGKDVIIAETAYPFTASNADSTANSISSSAPCSGYPASPTGQQSNYRDVVSAAQAGGAIGVFYWEPTWIATPGNGWDPTDINSSGDGWDNQALFDWNGKALPAIGSGGGSGPTNTPTGSGGGVGAGSYDDQGTGSPFVYTGSGWEHGACKSGEGCYNNDSSWSNTTNDTVAITFKGTQIKFYAVKDPGYGIAAVSIDGRSETNVDLYASAHTANALVWTSSTLASGTHTFKLRLTGTKNSRSSGTWIAVDRADVK